ncbi:MAG: hypothetical protein LBG93_00005, partial [Treponema sp.]|nr:hypothetical protein [Treponema sp.]
FELSQEISAMMSHPLSNLMVVYCNILNITWVRGNCQISSYPIRRACPIATTNRKKAVETKNSNLPSMMLYDSVMAE